MYSSDKLLALKELKGYALMCAIVGLSPEGVWFTVPDNVKEFKDDWTNTFGPKGREVNYLKIKSIVSDVVEHIDAADPSVYNRVLTLSNQIATIHGFGSIVNDSI